MLPFSLKESQQVNSLQVPQRGPYGETYPLTGHFSFSFNIFFYLSLTVPGKGAPSMFPNRVPMGSDIPSLIHSFIYLVFQRSIRVDKELVIR